MPIALLNTTVRLTHDVPELWLHRGEVGVVRSVWLSPADCYEVEFRPAGQCGVRALLKAEALQPVEAAPAAVARERRAMERKST